MKVKSCYRSELLVFGWISNSLSHRRNYWSLYNKEPG